MASNALILRFGAETAPARQAITQLATTGATQMASLGLAAAAAGRKMDSSLLSTLAKLAGSVTGLQVAYAGLGVAVASSLAIAIERMAEYRKVAESAAKVGVSTDFFQKFTQSAGQAKEQVQSLAAALQVAKDAVKDRLETPSSVGERLAEFNRNGAFLQEQASAYKGASDQEGRIRAVIAAVDELRARGYELEGLDLAEKLFGKSAADALISRADAAKSSLSAMVEATSDKKVVSPEQIANAQELENRLEAARKVMKDGMEPILKDLESLGIAIYSGWVRTEEQIGAAVKVLGSFYSMLKNTMSLMPSLEGIGDALEKAVNKAKAAYAGMQISILNQFPGLDATGKSKAEWEASRANAIGGTTRQGQRQLNDNAIPDVPMPNIGGPVLLGPNDPLAQVRPGRRGLLDKNNESAASKSGGGGAKEESDAYEKLIGNIEKATAALKAEYETLGLSRFERERAILLAKAEAELKEKGRELTAAERADLEAKIEAQARFKEIIEKTKSQMESMKELQNFIGSNVSSFLSDIISGGKNAEQALMNLTKRLADAALQAMLLGQGPLAGLFGTKGESGAVGGLVGGLFRAITGGGGAASPVATAGPLNIIPSFDVGTARVPRDMLATIHEGEMIVPKYDADLIRASKGAAGGSGGTTIVQNMTFNGQQDPAMLRVWAQQIENNTVARINADTARRGSVRPL